MGGPLTPLAPSSGPRDELTSLLSWRPWWRFHRDELLDVRRILIGRSPDTGAIESQRAALRRMLEPRLSKLIYAGGDVHEVSAALIAYGRIADERNVDVGPEVRHHALRQWKGDRPETIERASLSVAIADAPEALDDLIGLLADDALGLRLKDGADWPARSKGYAAYAIGLQARKSHDERDRREAVHALMGALTKTEATNAEERIASLFALSLVPLEACRTAAEMEEERRTMKHCGMHLCGQTQRDYLWDILRDSNYWPSTRMYAAIALGSLADDARFSYPGTDSHAPIRSREELVVDMLGVLRAAHTPQEVRRGIVIGLGACLRGGGSEVEREATELLVQRMKRGGPIERRYAAISLGRALARTPSTARDEAWEQSRAALEKQVLRGREGTKSWGALGLAFVGRTANRKARAHAQGVLLAALQKDSEPAEAAAIALAIAVVDREGADFETVLVNRFDQEQDEEWRSVARVVLGLIGSDRALGKLRAERDALAGEDTDPERLVSLLAGLRLAGDGEAAALFRKHLQAVLARVGEQSDAVAELEEPRKRIQREARVASARQKAVTLFKAAAELDLLESVPDLLSVLDLEGVPGSVRAGAIEALGVMADEDATDWAAPYSHRFDHSTPTWALLSPFGDGTGLLDHR